MSDKINGYAVETNPYIVERSKVVERCMCCGIPEQHKDYEVRRTHDFQDSLCEGCKGYLKKKSNLVLIVSLLGLALTIALSVITIKLIKIDDAMMMVWWYLGFHAIYGLPIMLLLGLVIKVPKTNLEDKYISPVAIIDKKLSKEAGAKTEGNVVYVFSNEDYAKDFAKACKAEVTILPDHITVPKKSLLHSAKGYVTLSFGVAFPVISIIFLAWSSIH